MPEQPPPLKVSAAFIAAGDLADFDAARRESIRSVIAAEARVAPREVELLITSASVRITAEITVATELAAAAAAASLSAGAFSSAAALQAAFDTGGVAIQVERISAAPQYGGDEPGGEIVSASNDALRSDGSDQHSVVAIVCVTVAAVFVLTGAIAVVVVIRTGVPLRKLLACHRCRLPRRREGQIGIRFDTVAVHKAADHIAGASATSSTTRESTTDSSEAWSEGKRDRGSLANEGSRGSLAISEGSRSSIYGHL